MTTLGETIAGTDVRPGRVMAWWLSGTGFVLKTPAGTQLYIDPYFSNCVAQIFGIDRAVPPPVPVDAAAPDLVIATHWHEDHLDPEALPRLAQRSPTGFLGPPSCRSRLLGWGVPDARIAAISAGERHTFRDVQVTAVPARHHAGIPGWEVPDAIGLLIDVDDGPRIYHTGDTEYDLRLRALAYDLARPIDAMMTVINGTGGNMNAHEAALLAWQLGPHTLMPMHHILWRDFSGGPQATLDPQLFADTYTRLGGAGRVHALAVGEGVELSAQPRA
ncbi:MAG: MBL fold metallo-hydrolase [Caldilineaceae bacterium]|nr:MBL fold metallo-hydrolase [Caldilineaceae bacterium]